MKLRWYQEEAVQAFFDFFRDNHTGNPLLVLPTGSGKSVVLAEILRRIYAWYANQKVLVLTHVKELVQQDYDKLLELWPTAPAGVCSAGLGRKETGNAITFAGIKTAYRRKEQFGHVHLVFVDEAHLVNSDGAGEYISLMGYLRTVNPAIRFIGLTATPYRLGQGKLTDPVYSRTLDVELPPLFTDIAYDLSSMEKFNRLVEEGFLCELISKRTNLALDVDGVRMQAGDYNNKQLELAVNKDEITRCAVEETLELGHDRNHCLVFAAGVDHARNVTNMLRIMGVSAVCVTGDMSREERDEAIAKFKAGEYWALVNNNILTTGFDFPAIDLIVMLRPTCSTNLWVQACGRGMRVHDSKENCLVLDFAGNTKRLGPINDPVPPRRRGKGAGQPPPVKECPLCGSYMHATVRVCTGIHKDGSACGHVFQFQTKLEQEASTLEIIKQQMPVVETFPVDYVTYNAHLKPGSHTSMKVSYVCGLKKFDEYVCLEHTGNIRNKAHRWWKERSIGGEVPETVLDALQVTGNLLQPKSIRVWVNKKYPEILGYEL